MTPYEIGVLLHYYCRVGDHEDLQRKPPVWTPTIDGFQLNGLIETTFNADDALYAITDKGKAYIDALQRVPLPVQVWTIPDQEPLAHAIIREARRMPFNDRTR